MDLTQDAFENSLIPIGGQYQLLVRYRNTKFRKYKTSRFFRPAKDKQSSSKNEPNERASKEDTSKLFELRFELMEVHLLYEGRLGCVNTYQV